MFRRSPPLQNLLRVRSARRRVCCNKIREICLHLGDEVLNDWSQDRLGLVRHWRAGESKYDTLAQSGSGDRGNIMCRGLLLVI